VMVLSRILAIAVNTLREAIRNKLLYTLLFFSIAVIGAAVLIASLSYVDGERIIQDVGLSAIRLFSVGIAIFVGVGMIHGEVDRRTIYTILAKPVSRGEFLLGKFLGLLLTVWLQLLLMVVAFVAISLGTGAPLSSVHAAALFLTGMELMLIVAVATFFSSFTTPALATLFSLGIYALGHLSRDLLSLGGRADTQAVRTAAQWVYNVLPDLESFNLTIQAAHGLQISGAEIGLPALYACGYTTLVVLGALAIFRRRDMK